ncbi:MAG TPA: Rieske 2Fe-2S domain-containing protein, partial [Chloroflexota bacterium]
MISQAENELLTQVGPGTPGGEMLRRYWHPICAAGELTSEHPKKRIRMLGEDLVAFRSPDGGYGLVEEHCSHRGASLYYGFLEDGCIRCAYHGWMYDREGRCVEQPFEPEQSMLKHVIRHPAYPVEKLGGLLFAYMGPPEFKPLLPRWDILVWKDVFQKIETRPVLHCNWLQPEENSADTTHLYYLHAHVFRVKGQPPRGDGRESGIKSFGFQPFKWGIIKSWIFEDKPGGPEWGKMVVFPNMLRLNNALHWRVPIDDVSTRIIRVDFRPLHDGEQPRAEDEEPPFSYEASWLNEQGEYHMDTQSSQDGMAWETQGAIWDRTREHLGASDTGIVMLREMIMDAIATVHRGE